MANIMGSRGINEAAQLADNLKDFSGTMKKMHEHYKEEQLKLGLTEYKQYKKVKDATELLIPIQQYEVRQKLLIKKSCLTQSCIKMIC